MKPFIALSAAAGMVAAAAGLFVLNLSDSSSQAGLVLSYSEGSNTAVNAEPTLTEDNLQVRSAQPRPDPTTASNPDQEDEEPAPTAEILATEEPEATATETATAEATESPTPTPTATEEPTPTAPPATASGNALLDTVNAVRATFGKSALLPDAALMSAAQSYCRTVGEYFDQNGSLNHEIGGSIGSRFKAHGFTGSAWGEALAWTANAASASLFDEVAASWRNSSGHSALLYSPSTGYGGKAYTHAGAASCTSPGGTGIYVLDVGAY